MFRLSKRFRESFRKPGGLVVIGLAVLILWVFGSSTLKLPLLGDHCMKTSKTIEVAYNMVRYRDPFNKYADWQATPQNPLGHRGNIATYESPLSAYTLAAVYLVVDSADFMTRLNAGRIFTLVHLIGAYLLLAFYIFRKDLFLLSVFSFFLVLSSFTISYSTKPLAETHALLYQALLIVIATGLLLRKMSPMKKSVILALGVVLLCTGGKMNYFILAAPLVALFPFLDRSLVGTREKLKYFTLFLGVAALGAIILLVFTTFSFERAIIYLIKGNKPILNDSLWDTFVEGFNGFRDVYKRTLKQFGPIVFYSGQAGGVYLIGKLGCFLVAKRNQPLSRFDAFQGVLALFVLGHLVNYAVLRNLFIPHRYYVVPIYMIFCLVMAVMAADLRALLVRPNRWRDRLLRIIRNRFSRLPRNRDGDPSLRKAAGTLVFFFATIAALLGTVYAIFRESDHWRVTFIEAVKGVTGRYLAKDLGAAYDQLTATLGVVAAAAGLLAVLIAVVATVFRSFGPLRQRAKRASDLFVRQRFHAGSIILGGAIALAASYATIKTSQGFHQYILSHKEHVDNAKALAKIRENTQSGDLVLCWKWCIAFYADKRSITEATPRELKYYQENNIHSVMGPVRPLDLYYKRIENYDEPMSYWRPKTQAELEEERLNRVRARTRARAANQ